MCITHTHTYTEAQVLKSILVTEVFLFKSKGHRSIKLHTTLIKFNI